jgi:hypothetical protein
MKLIVAFSNFASMPKKELIAAEQRKLKTTPLLEYDVTPQHVIIMFLRDAMPRNCNQVQVLTH